MPLFPSRQGCEREGRGSTSTAWDPRGSGTRPARNAGERERRCVGRTGEPAPGTRPRGSSRSRLLLGTVGVHFARPLRVSPRPGRPARRPIGSDSAPAGAAERAVHGARWATARAAAAATSSGSTATSRTRSGARRCWVSLAAPGVGLRGPAPLALLEPGAGRGIPRLEVGLGGTRAFRWGRGPPPPLGPRIHPGMPARLCLLAAGPDTERGYWSARLGYTSVARWYRGPRPPCPLRDRPCRAGPTCHLCPSD